MDNPFLFGKPVEPDKFIGHEAELRQLFRQFAQQQNFIVTGQPRIGKTSLLRKSLDSLKKFDPSEPSLLIPIEITAGYFHPNSTPVDFWCYVVKEMAKVVRSDPIQVSDNYFFELEDYIHQLKDTGKKFILMLDGAGWLFSNRNFDSSFFHGLRGLLTNASLSLVIFSRLDIGEMLTKDDRDEIISSPFLNLFSGQIALAPFSSNETLQLLDVYTVGKESLLTPKDKRVIWQLSGGHPFVVQLSASVIWEARRDGHPVSADNYEGIKNAILNHADYHFGDVWRFLSPTAKVIGLMITLRELASHYKYNTLDLDKIIKARITNISELKNSGLVLIENEVPFLSSLSFSMWILRKQIDPGMEISQPEEWLRQNQQIFGPLTRKQIDDLSTSVGKIYKELRSSLVDLAEALARARLGL